MNIEDFFQESKGLSVQDATNASARYTAIDICRFAKAYHKSESDTTLSLPDIRNKLSPISNLIALLESSEFMYHNETEVHNIIVQEIEQCKKSIEYLSGNVK